MKKIAMLAAATAFLLTGGAASAAEVEIKLFNKGNDGGMYSTSPW